VTRAYSAQSRASQPSALLAQSAIGGRHAHLLSWLRSAPDDLVVSRRWRQHDTRIEGGELSIYNFSISTYIVVE